jgi:chromosomal replication initiation ATPase DnaA
MLIQVSTPASVAELRALYRRTRAHFAVAPSSVAVSSARTLRAPAPWPAARFSGRETLRIVAQHFGLAPADVVGDARPRRIVIARWIVMHICVEVGRYTATRAGRLLGRDHTTVTHGLRELAALVARDAALADALARLTRQCLPDAAPATAGIRTRGGNR